MGFPTYLSFTLKHETQLPEKFAHDDVRYTKELVGYFLNKFTRIGDIVLDPFAGYGTTIQTANNEGRIGYGVEINEEVYNYLTIDLNLRNITLGSIKTLDTATFPKFDFLMTSPPYMGKTEEVNALSGWTEVGGYEDYLIDMQDIFLRIKDMMKFNAKLVIEVSNIKSEGVVTTLAWDIGGLLSKVFSFQGEVIINWEGERNESGIYGGGYDHSYCLIFENKEIS